MSLPGTYTKSDKTLFDKLESFGAKSTTQQKLIKNLAIMVLEVICVQEGTFTKSPASTWIGQKITISINIVFPKSSKGAVFCKWHPHQLVETFIDALENSASQSKATQKILFPDIKTTMKIKLGSILEEVNHHANRREQVNTISPYD